MDRYWTDFFHSHNRTTTNTTTHDYTTTHTHTHKHTTRTSTNAQMVRRTLLQGQVSEIRGSFSSSGEYPFHQVLCCQIVSNWGIFDFRRNDFQRKLSLCLPQVLNPIIHVAIRHDFVEFWRILRNVTSWNQVSWSLVVNCHPWWLLMLKQVS